MKKPLLPGLATSLCAVLVVVVPCIFSQEAEAPAAFDGQSNGLTDQATHTADEDKFEEVEKLSDGLGPVYNAQSCRECHQNPATGGASQIAELRVGHTGRNGQFENPRGSRSIKGRKL